MRVVAGTRKYADNLKRKKGMGVRKQKKPRSAKQMARLTRALRRDNVKGATIMRCGQS